MDVITAPHIDFDLLKQITDVVDIPLVLHGGSGTGDENLRKAVKWYSESQPCNRTCRCREEELETLFKIKTLINGS